MFIINQPWSVPEVLRPLYESSTVLAQKTTMVVRLFLPVSVLHSCPFFFWFPSQTPDCLEKGLCTHCSFRKRMRILFSDFLLGSTPTEADSSRGFSV